MHRSFFPSDAHFYKANLHCHTTISDGAMTPTEIKAAYLAAGYAAVAFTDHEVLLPHAELTDDHFIALHGFETAVKARPGEHTGNFQPVYHLNLIARAQDNIIQPFIYPGNMTPGNCRQYFPQVSYREELVYEYSVDGVNDLIRRGREAGFFVTLNHPAWSMVAPAEYLALNGLDGIEVLNTDCFAHGDCTGLPLGEFLRCGKSPVPIGGDDNHNRHGLDGSFGAFTMIAAREFSYAGLTEALANGWCYASSGPLIYDIWQEEEKIGLSCSPSSTIYLLSEGRYVVANHGTDIEEAVFSIKPEKMGSFVRFVVVDAAGQHAFSCGIFL